MQPSILLTGGSGRLGRYLRGVLPEVTAPSSSEMDVTDPQAVHRWMEQLRPALVVHCAAYTNTEAANWERARCWAVNVEGTTNVVRAAMQHRARLVHISTDYVFWGDRGGYREDEIPGPVRNHYSLTKLVAESCVRFHPQHLVIRTSFRAGIWPHRTAFSDLFTSQDMLDVIGPRIAEAIRRQREIPYETLHIATHRKSMLELARRTRPGVEAASRTDAPLALPRDISLDISRWTELQARWAGAKRADSPAPARQFP